MKKTRAAFTLIEVLVAGAVILLILGILFSLTDQTQRLVGSTSAKVEQFAGARVAFDTMTRRLGGATLNTYWEYRYVERSDTVSGTPVKTKIPAGYRRASELRFRSGPMSDLQLGLSAKHIFQPTHGVFFQAPNGLVEDPAQLGSLDHLLNTWGYFVEANTDADTMPDFLRGRVNERRRHRLMEVMEPSERLRVYEFQGAGADGWYAELATRRGRPVRVLAENVVALVLLPRLSKSDEDAWRQGNGSREPVLAKNYRYDSTASSPDRALNSHHQLPPVMQVTMVAIDEPSALRLDAEFPDDPALGISYKNIFQQPENFERDLEEFKTRLTARKVNYRVFTTNVAIRGAKWSMHQTD